MVGFGNFARIASLCMGFHLDTLHGYFLQQDFWPNLSFPLKHQIKLFSISARKHNKNLDYVFGVCDERMV